jgi:hypothetical protein
MPAADLAALIREKHGVEITPPMVAIVKAALLQKELLAKYRQEGKSAQKK